MKRILTGALGAARKNFFPLPWGEDGRASGRVRVGSANLPALRDLRPCSSFVETTADLRIGGPRYALGGSHVNGPETRPPRRESIRAF
jgi:hypothetical protein